MGKIKAPIVADIVVICVILFFPYLYFFHILLHVYMLNRDPIM